MLPRHAHNYQANITIRNSSVQIFQYHIQEASLQGIIGITKEIGEKTLTLRWGLEWVLSLLVLSNIKYSVLWVIDIMLIDIITQVFENTFFMYYTTNIEDSSNIFIAWSQNVKISSVTEHFILIFILTIVKVLTIRE